jgi:hypothetical protein
MGQNLRKLSIHQGRPPQKMNGMAIVGFVFTFLFAPLGCIFSLIGLSQISKNPSQSGKGLALSGAVISLILIMIAVVLIVVNQLQVEFDAAQDAALN